MNTKLKEWLASQNVTFPEKTPIRVTPPPIPLRPVWQSYPGQPLEEYTKSRDEHFDWANTFDVTVLIVFEKKVTLFPNPQDHRIFSEGSGGSVQAVSFQHLFRYAALIQKGEIFWMFAEDALALLTGTATAPEKESEQVKTLKEDKEYLTNSLMEAKEFLTTSQTLFSDYSQKLEDSLATINQRILEINS